jgi:hypothetical protein
VYSIGHNGEICAKCHYQEETVWQVPTEQTGRLSPAVRHSSSKQGARTATGGEFLNWVTLQVLTAGRVLGRLSLYSGKSLPTFQMLLLPALSGPAK